MAVVQLRNPTPGRQFYDARKAGGTPSLMAMRALKRRLSNVVYARMVADQNRRDQAQVTGPGGHQGNDSVSSAAGSHPEHRLFGPATPGPETSLRSTAALTPAIPPSGPPAKKTRRAT